MAMRTHDAISPSKKMTFEKEMDRFRKRINEPEDREFMQGDPQYQQAVKAKNVAKAQELACAYVYDLVEVREWMQSKRKKQS
jgi:hypothetical protein